MTSIDKKLYDKKYYLKNKEKRNKQTAEWYSKNTALARSLNKANYEKLTKADLAKKQKKYRQENPVRHAFVRSKASAKARGLKFNLDESDIQIPEFCPVFGVKLEIAGPCRNNSVSIDRIDNSKGYVKGNIWVISNRANKIKGNLSLDELLLLVEALKKVWIKT